MQRDPKSFISTTPIFVELCGKQVLVESKIDGKPLSQYYITADDPVDEAHAHLARCGADLVFQMVLTDNFFHADIHPGNILVGWFPNDPLPFLGMLDVGVTQTLTQHQRDVSHKFMASIVRKDWDDTTKYILEMGGEQPYCDKAAFIRVRVQNPVELRVVFVPGLQKRFRDRPRFGAHAGLRECGQGRLTPPPRSEDSPDGNLR